MLKKSLLTGCSNKLYNNGERDFPVRESFPGGLKCNQSFLTEEFDISICLHLFKRIRVDEVMSA